MFVGLWPPMFWLIGDTIRRREEQLERPRGIRSALRPSSALATPRKRAPCSRPRFLRPFAR